MGVLKDALLEAWQSVIDEQAGKTCDEKIIQAFRNGVAVGLLVGCTLASAGWVSFFWLASLAR